ncbi:hypothetical protein HYH02_010736 [Chlamydomonas schloesseri]|uniref:Uncharacterized protein n=1 Tax=Chlamydomonas schloesseri TaxID=2026947 RepID=A0A835W6A8_9CHLO|nr:hypothetical protein HYH02_010736 [Chlamydomonas schloesseri]|eukprot:KAG2438943.1 hypothetical protein HYH02_010736 [Chlamydomonas schloesseri]
MLHDKVAESAPAAAARRGGGAAGARERLRAPVDLAAKLLLEPLLASAPAVGGEAVGPTALAASHNVNRPQQQQQQQVVAAHATAGPVGRVGCIAGQGAGGGGAAEVAAATPAAAVSGAALQRQLAVGLPALQLGALLHPTTGRPSGLAGLAAHLFWAEPSNLALCRLLREGVFEHMLERLRGRALLEEAVLVLAHLFLRVPLSPAMAARVARREFAGRSPSVVALPPLSPDAAQCLAGYTQELQASALASLVACFGSEQGQARAVLDPVLPLSGIRHQTAAASSTAAASPPCDSSGGAAGVDAAAAREGGGCAGVSAAAGMAQTVGVGVVGLLPLLRRMRRHVVVASPYMALSGRGDDFLGRADMLLAARPDAELQASNLALLETCNRRGEPLLLNAWMYDFYKHGSPAALLKDNNIREGDVWDLLDSARRVLAAAALALQLAAEAEAEVEVAAEAGGQPPTGERAPRQDAEAAAEDRLGAGELADRLTKLQDMPGPAPCSRQCAMVALLFRAVATEFTVAVRRVGA